MGVARKLPSSDKLVVGRSGIRVERIAFSSDGPQQVGPGSKGEAESAHEDIDGSKLDILIMGPNCFEQLLPGEDSLRVPQEMLQQAVLGRADVYSMPAAAHSARHRVHFEIGVAELLGS